jgi:hypothetical protein
VTVLFTVLPLTTILIISQQKTFVKHFLKKISDFFEKTSKRPDIAKRTLKKFAVSGYFFHCSDKISENFPAAGCTKADGHSCPSACIISP